MNINIKQLLISSFYGILLAFAQPLLAQDPAPATDGPACMADGSECPCKHHGMHGGHHGKGGPGGMGPAMAMGRFERMGDELGLSEAKKQELATLVGMYQPRMVELWKRGETSRKAVMTMAPDDPAYNTRAAELSQEAGASAAEMVTLLTELQSNAYALLDDEQQAKYMQMRSEGQARMEAKKAEIKAKRESGEWQPGMYPHGAPAAE